MTSTTVRPTTWRLFVAGLLLALLAAGPARAACVTDQRGADDQPGQKDLTEWCEPGPTCSSSSATASLRWQLDDLNWSGNNTGDSCALIDTNRDGLADRAICVTVFGAAQMGGKCSKNQFLGCIRNQDCGSAGPCILPINNTGAPRCYTCGNDRPTRCTNSRPVACTSLCSVGVVMGSDPFSGVASHTARKCSGTNCVRDDTAVNCCLASTDLGVTGELIDVCSYPSQQPNSDPSDCVLTPPNCSLDTDCNDQNPCTVDKCVSGTGGVKFCDNAPGNAGTVCRPSAGPCDVAETCTGTSRECPADTFAAAGTPCRASAGVCDPPETCTGTSASCPADAKSPAGTVCRPAADVCDVPETCDGTSNTCPSDGSLPASTVCRPSAGPCDPAEYCTGSSAGCPPDGFQSSSTVCRPSAGPCDPAEYCTGSSADCPPDDSGGACIPCATAADCNDNNVCTYDSCDGGVCSNTAIEGCNPCTTAADCNDGNACTVESCVAGVCKNTPIPGCTPCTTVTDCDDHNACTTDTCNAGVCHHAAVSGCIPCTTAANCNDFNACTTDACIGGVCVYTNTCLAPEAAPTEICGNCIDDNGNGLTDFEDPACSGQAGTLTLEEGLLRRAGDATRLDLHTALAGLGVNPLADDVILQIRPENGTDVLCARIPAGSFVKHRRLFKFADPKHAVASAQGLDHVKIQVPANGNVRLLAGGKRARMTCPDAGPLQVTVGFHDATAGDGGDRSATIVQTFSAGPNGSLGIP